MNPTIVLSAIIATSLSFAHPPAPWFGPIGFGFNLWGAPSFGGFGNSDECDCGSYGFGNSDECGCGHSPGDIGQHNWGGNFNYSTNNIQYPRSVAEVQYIVKRSKRLRVMGSRHSFSKIGDSHCKLLSTQGLCNVIGINASVPSVTVQAGVRYMDMYTTLQSAGFALEMLAALGTITVAGAIQTGVHGSGLTAGSLTTQVRSLQLVRADGRVEDIGPDDSRLPAVALGLGMFGVVTQVELNLVPTYNLTMLTYTLTADQLFANFNAIMNVSYSVLLVNPTFTKTFIAQVKVRSGMDDVNTVNNTMTQFGAIFLSQGVSQPWFNDLITFTNLGTDGDQHQSEYFVPLSKATTAIRGILNISANMIPANSTLVIRSIKNDSLWMSEYNGNEPMIATQFSWPNDLPAINGVLPTIEQILSPLGVRPHWGKYYTMEPSVYLKEYPKLREFKKLARKMDPEGKFHNEFLHQNIKLR